MAVFTVVLAEAGIGGALILYREPEPPREPPAQPVGAFAGHGPSYSSLRELADRSDLVVVGTVTDSRIGEVFDDDPTGEYPTRMLHTTVRVEEAMKGSSPSADINIRTDELAFADPNVKEWRQPGVRVLLFLTPGTEGRYLLANRNSLQTSFLVQGEEVEATVGDPLSARIAAMNLREIRQEVRRLP